MPPEGFEPTTQSSIMVQVCQANPYAFREPAPILFRSIVFVIVHGTGQRAFLSVDVSAIRP